MTWRSALRFSLRRANRENIWVPSLPMNGTKIVLYRLWRSWNLEKDYQNESTHILQSQVLSSTSSTIRWPYWSSYWYTLYMAKLVKRKWIIYAQEGFNLPEAFGDIIYISYEEYIKDYFVLHYLCLEENPITSPYNFFTLF